MRKYSGPYLVEKVIGEVNVIITKNRNAKPMTVHIDKLKPYTAEDTPWSWLEEVLEETVVREKVNREEVKRDGRSEEKWINETEDEVEALNVPGSQEKISASEVVPAEEASRKAEEVLDEQPIAGIPPAQCKTPRPKCERRVPIRYQL